MSRSVVYLIDMDESGSLDDVGLDSGAAEQLEPGGRAAAPGQLALVQRFVNTWNHEFPVEQDRLGTTRSASTWLRDNDLVDIADRPAMVTASQLDAVRDLREAIRALATANVTGSCDPAALRTIDIAAAAAPVAFTIGDDRRIRLHTHVDGVHRVVATLLAIIHDAQVVGDWARFKGCRQCGYVFYDSSKNCSATWCSMSICGNRVKNRSYQQRQRSRATA
jgi:predicted RNA-binding Zn ribbon-like protein